MRLPLLHMNIDIFFYQSSFQDYFEAIKRNNDYLRETVEEREMLEKEKAKEEKEDKKDDLVALEDIKTGKE